MAAEDIVSPNARYRSRFMTNGRNIFLFWLSYFVILPAFVWLFFLLFTDPSLPVPRSPSPSTSAATPTVASNAFTNTTLAGVVPVAITKSVTMLKQFPGVISDIPKLRESISSSSTAPQGILVLLAFLLILPSALVPVAWRFHGKDRLPALIIAGLLTAPWIFPFGDASIHQGISRYLVLTITLWIVVGLLIAIKSRTRWFWSAVWLLLFVTIFYILFTTIDTLKNLPVSPMIGACIVGNECQELDDWFLLFWQVGVWAILLLILWGASKRTSLSESLSYGLRYLPLILLSLLALSRWLGWISPNIGLTSGFVAVIALVTWLMTTDFPRLLSNHRAYWRTIFRRFRYERLYSRFSPFVRVRNPLNRFANIQRNIFSFDYYRLWIVITGLIGLIVIPSVAFWISKWLTTEGGVLPNSALLVLAVSGAILLPILYIFSISLLRNRYIVTEFEIINEPEVSNETRNILSPNARMVAPELKAVARLVTHALAEELQRTASLLKMRQVENLHFDSDDNNAFFVTSGIDQEFFNQMQQVVTVEVPSTGRINIPGLIQTLSRLVARILVRGTVQRRSNGSVEVWVEFNQRSNRTAAVDMMILPENSLEEIDEVFIRPVARQLALKLLIATGRVPHLGSTWQTLDYHLKGIEASSRRNWWQAISFYRQALQAEETSHGSFGIGHFHLGAALVFQGNWREGYEHLRIAEADGPPMAEMQYMLALALLYIYWGELHKRPNIFGEIEDRCHRAISLRDDFAEAHQLLGTAQYRYARNLDRKATRSGISHMEPPAMPDGDTKKETTGSDQGGAGNPIGSPSGNEAHTGAGSSRHDSSRDNDIVSREREQQPAAIEENSSAERAKARALFHKSVSSFRRALRYYDRMHRRKHEMPSYDISQDQSIRLIQHRMTVSHQIADALRALDHHLEAESYYADVSVIYPRVTRNLADMGKSLCMSQSWERMEEYLWREIMKDDIARWDADIAIHAGWCISGGVYQQFHTGISQALFSAINWFYPRRNSSQPLDKRPRNKADALQLMGEAMEFLDFALHQRPRYLEAWRQTDWYNTYETALQTVGGKDLPEDPKEHSFANPGAKWYRQWIALRVDGFSHMPGENEVVKKFFTEVKKEGKFQKFIAHHKKLVDARTYLADPEEPKDKKTESKIRDKTRPRFSDSIANGTVDQRLIISFDRVEMARVLFKEWEVVKADFKLLDDAHKLEFRGRWALDVYQEWTLLTCRALAEAGAFEKLYGLTNEAQEIMAEWMAAWVEKYPIADKELRRDKPYYTFSPYVNRFQRATILAWHAYSHFQCCFDRSTRFRLTSEGANTETVCPPDIGNEDKLISSVNKYLKEARKLVQYHPLAMFVQALVFRQLGLQSQAIEELERLLDVVAPFDPKQDVGSSVFAAEAPNPTTSDSRNRLYRLERVCGRQQFHHLVNPTNLHSLLADAYLDAKKPDLSVFHLMEAVRWASYSDNASAVAISLRLANQLNFMERYAEAQAVLEAMRDHNQQVIPGGLSPIQRNATDILECVINTRRMQYTISLQEGKEVAHRFTFSVLPRVELPAAKPPAAKPPAVEPPAAKPPAVEPPAVEPPVERDSWKIIRDEIGNLLASKHSQGREALKNFVDSTISRIKVERHKSAENQPVAMQEGENSLAKYHPVRSDVRSQTEEVVLKAFTHKHGLIVNRLDDFVTQIVDGTKHIEVAKDMSLAQVIARVYELAHGDRLGKQCTEFSELISWAVNCHHSDADGATAANFPRVFRELYAQGPELPKILNKTAILSTCYVSKGCLQALWQHLYQQKTSELLLDRQFDRVFMSHVVVHYAEAAWSSLVQFAELCNSLAYNRAETGLHDQNYAFIDSHSALVVMAFLSEVSQRDTPLHTEFAEVMAQVCDTFGWLHYRKAFPSIREGLHPSRRGGNPWLHETYELLEDAESFLQKGIRYDPTRAIIHYHLARAYLSCVELLWQTDPKQVGEATVGNLAPKIDNYLTQALREWRNANQFDQFGRLHERLSWLYNRISVYKHAWERRQLSGIAGTPEPIFVLGSGQHDR